SASKQTCTKCGKRKPYGEFYYRDGKPDRICKDSKKSAQTDTAKKKTLPQNADSAIGSMLNKIREYKILRGKLVTEQRGRLLSECETQLQGKKWAAAS